MAYARTRKHYRVAKKEMETSPSKGTFISRTQRNHLILMAVAIMVLAMIKGFVFGYIVGRND